MSYKIRISDTNDIVLEIKERKDEPWLNVYKTVFSDRYTGIAKDSALAFNIDQAKKLNSIIQTIDSQNYEFKEYGELQKGYKLFKVYISSFKGNNSLQIRAWIESDTYTGFGKQGVSIPTEKIFELQGYLPELIEEFDGLLGNTNIKKEKIVIEQPKIERASKKTGNGADIESYF